MIFNDIIDLFFPCMCVLCREGGKLICDSCRDELEFSEQICPECGEYSLMGWSHDRCVCRYGMDGLVCVYNYQDERVRVIIDKIKFGFNRHLLRELLKGMTFQIGASFDMVVPVPLYWYRKNWRGFNQAEDVAEYIGSKLNIEMLDVLKRWRNTQQQSALKNRKERQTNIRGAFEVRNKWRTELKGKNILLVDDVFTSGASMKECAKILKKSGARVVWGIVLAH